MRKEVIRVTISVEVPVGMSSDAFKDFIWELARPAITEPDIELASLTHDRKD